MTEVAEHHARAKAAADHADSKVSEWTLVASVAFNEYAMSVGRPFLTSEAASYARGVGVPEPPDNRAWGHIAKAMHSAGFVHHAGYATDRYGSPKHLWSVSKE